MTGYAVVQLVHGYWRWAVLAAAAVVLVRASAGLLGRRDWTLADERASRSLVAAVDVQVLLGLVLYFAFSPFFTALHQTFRLTLQSPTTRFFAIEHGVAMLLGATAVHLGRVRARRAAGAPARHRTLLVSTLVFLALAAWAIPWPWRAIGRPLFRTTL